MLATTATANERVVTDVADQLAVGADGAAYDVLVQRGSLERESLRLGVLRLERPEDQLGWLVEHLDDLPGSGIIYTLTVAGACAEDVAALLRASGHDVVAYSRTYGHGRPPRDRGARRGVADARRTDGHGACRTSADVRISPRRIPVVASSHQIPAQRCVEAVASTEARSSSALHAFISGDALGWVGRGPGSPSITSASTVTDHNSVSSLSARNAKVASSIDGGTSRFEFHAWQGLPQREVWDRSLI